MSMNVISTIEAQQFIAFFIFYRTIVFVSLYYKLDKKKYKMTNKEYYLFYQEIASQFHGAIAIASSAYFLFWKPELDPAHASISDSERFSQPNSFINLIAVTNTLGYMFNDTLCMMMYGSGDGGMYAHHLLTVVSLFTLLYVGTGAAY